MRRRARPRSGRSVAAMADYQAWINSYEWKVTRRHQWADEEADRGRALVCHGCGQDWEVDADDLHHVTYERLRHEAHEDLMALCRPCHDYVHQVLRRPGARAVGRINTQRAALAVLQRHADSRESE